MFNVINVIHFLQNISTQLQKNPQSNLAYE